MEKVFALKITTNVGEVFFDIGEKEQILAKIPFLVEDIHQSNMREGNILTMRITNLVTNEGTEAEMKDWIGVGD